MATIINNPPSTASQVPASTNDNSGSNWMIAIVFLILFFVLFVYFVVPVLRRAATPSAPAQVNVPGKIDVNLNTNK